MMERFAHQVPPFLNEEGTASGRVAGEWGLCSAKNIDNDKYRCCAVEFAGLSKYRTRFELAGDSNGHFFGARGLSG